MPNGFTNPHYNQLARKGIQNLTAGHSSHTEVKNKKMHPNIQKDCIQNFYSGREG